MATTERFLAAKSRIVLKPKNSPAMWYELKKDVIVAGEPGHGQCPITGKRVRFVNESGFLLYFPENIVRERLVVADGDINDEFAARFRPVLFTYDIPDASDYPNPSGVLRRYAVRLNLSCWLMDAGDIPNAMIGEMLDANCDPHTFRFDPADSKKLLTVAVAKLSREIDMAVRSAARSAQNAASQLATATATTGMSAEDAHARYEKRAAAVNARLDVLKGDLAAAAERLGINPEAIKLDRLALAGNELRDEMATRARAYLDAARAAEATGTDTGRAIAAAIRSDTMDPMVAADFLDENGGDGSDLRAAFDTAPKPEPVLPATDDDGTYSLDTGDDAE